MNSDNSANPDFASAAKVRLSSWEPGLTSAQLSACEVFISELLHFNKTLNLISTGTTTRVDAVHILDVVRAWSLISPLIPKGSVVVDFGTGNGLPGVLAAALSPDLNFRLVDRDQRKLEFCKHVIAKLSLTNVTVSCMDVTKLPAGSVQFAISRGFASVMKSLLMSRSIFAKDGVFFMMKGESWALELAELPPPLFSVWKSSMVGEYDLPESAAKFVVLKSVKTGE